MSYTNSTEFYEIPLPEETDLVNPMDDNDAKVRVDTDLHAAVQNASSAVSTANAASDAAAAATSGLEALSETVNVEKGKLTALTARVTAAENEIDDVRGDSEDMICAYNEPTATSTHAYSAGDFFIYNDVLYKATDTIAIGDTIVPNTNCAATNVTTEVDAINTALSDKADKQKSYSVQSDGVKTYAQIITELQTRSASDIFTVLTKLSMDGAMFNLTDYTSRKFDNVSNHATGIIVGEVILTNSTYKFRIVADTITNDDASNSVPTAGKYFTLYI